MTRCFLQINIYFHKEESKAFYINLCNHKEFSAVAFVCHGNWSICDYIQCNESYFFNYIVGTIIDVWLYAWSTEVFTFLYEIKANVYSSIRNRIIGNENLKTKSIDLVFFRINRRLFSISRFFARFPVVTVSFAVCLNCNY